MKTCFSFVILIFCAILCIGQPDTQITHETLGTDIPDRKTLVKNSMQVNQWHEESFWVTYDRYDLKVQEVSTECNARLNKLARLGETADPLAAFDGAERMLMDRYHQILLWQQYFQEITASNNGAIGLKFLQTETLLAMMDEANIYEAAAGRVYHSLANNRPPLSRTARRNEVSKALLISDDKRAIFAETFDKYETERIDLLGDDYSVYDLYVGDLTDFSPAFSKRLGRDFIEVMWREAKLKEKYLTEMARALDPAIAARFIALEDYHAIQGKMYLWSTADMDLVADASN